MTIVTTTYRYKPPPRRKGRKLAEITGPAVVTAKGSRRPAWEKAAAELEMSCSHPTAGDIQPSTPPGKASTPANDDSPRRSAIVTAPDRKTVQRQREQQQMAKLMAPEEVSPETKDLVDRMMLGRRPGSADERPGIIPKLSNGRRRSWTK